MNYKFRKKPVEIEAFQMTKKRRIDNRDWPEWLNKAWNKDRGAEGSVFPTKKGDGDCDGTVSIRTLEGEMLVNFDDYIIRGIHGELYPCKPDIFEATYESWSNQITYEITYESMYESMYETT